MTFIAIIFSAIASAQNISTIAGTGVAGNTGDGGPATAATLDQPTSVAADGSGNIYIASGNVIRKINTSGTISTIAGIGAAGYSGDGGPATAARLNNPMGLALDALGNLYFADRFNNRVRVVSTSGIIATILGNGAYTSTGDGGLATAATCGWPADVAIDAAGNIFIADEGGERIRKIDVGGIINTIAGSGCMGCGAFSGDGGPAALARFDAPVGIAVDGPGNVYISDYYNNRIRFINTSSIMNTYVGTGAGVYGGDGGPAAAAMVHNTWAVRTDAAGNLYIADQANNRIRMVNSSGVITTIAGDGTAGYGGDGGPATAAKINQPTAAVTDADGNIYIADFANNVVRKINMCTPPIAAPITGLSTVCQGAGTTLSDITPGGVWLSTNTAVATISAGGVVTGISGGTTTISYTVTNTCGTATATFAMTVNPLPVVAPIAGSSSVCPTESILLTDATPGGVWSSSSAAIATVDGTGMVTGVASGIVNISYSVTNSCGTTSSIKNVSVGGTSIVITIAGSSTAGYTGDGGPASAALLDQPGGMAIDATGNIYFADDQHHVVRKIDVSGIITTIAGTGTIGYSGDGGAATSAMLSLPKDVAVDAAGNVYIADYFNKRIRKVTPAGLISTVAGNGGSGYGGDGVMATATTVFNPYGIAVDGAGNLYISDYGNQRIRKVNTTGIISTIAGTGTIGSLGDGGPATNARINNPHGLTVDAAGNVYFADYANHRIRKINTSGIITLFAGGLGSGYSGDGGPATAARVFNPTSVRLDALGNVFIADYVNGRIRKVDPSGIITSISGTIGGSGYSGDGGPATAARFAGAIGCSIDASGNVYISDEGNNRIRKVFPGLAPVAAITGTATVCTGGNTTLSCATVGGVWSSSASGIATVAASGVVTGVAPGTATISYSVTSGCGTNAASIVVTVSNLPVAGTLTGVAVVCQGGTGALSVLGGDAGGAWSSSIPANATVNAVSGVFTGIAAGTTVISYTVTNACSSMSAIATISVNPAPNAGSISGTATVCPAATTNLTITGGDAGGVWSSVTTSIATINPSTGIVTGVAPGTTLISYTAANSCGTASATRVVTVNAPPTGGTITGSTPVCPAGSITLSNSTATPGGAWTSVTPAVATINSSTGLATGVTTGTTLISYTVTNACGTASATTVVTVNLLPNAGTVTGTATVCVGATTFFSNAVSGGVWTSSTPARATVDATGLVTGISPGTATISYSVTNSCGTAAATRVVTVNSIPAIGGITGTASVCQGLTTTLSNATAGGAWTSSDVATATIGATGIVSGIASGTSVISYGVTNSCGTNYATRVVTVNSLPAPIAGPDNLCAGGTITLTDATPGGNWSRSNTNVTIGAASGIVNGITAGTTIITYTLPTSCLITATITVNALPTSLAVTGGGNYCASGTGVNIGLINSETGINYQLYLGATTAGGMLSGTGTALDFGLITAAGTYTVLATNPTTGCSGPMGGSATVVIVPNVVPAVSIAPSFSGPATCNGTLVTFTATPVNGGTSPTYQWYVNGVMAGTAANNYSYTPVNGDVVSVTLTPGAICVSPATAGSTYTVSVLPMAMPSVSIAVSPGNPVCKGTLTTFSASPVNGGAAPTYLWTKNGINVATGPTHSYIPDDGDIVAVKLTSNYLCRLADFATGTPVTMSVQSGAPAPSIAITAVPSTIIAPGMTVTLTAVATGGTATKLLQWYVNGIAIAGATGTIYTSNTFSNEDIVTVRVANNDVCAKSQLGSVKIYVQGLGINEPKLQHAGISIYPDPNSGEFVVKTSTVNTTDGFASVMITNTLGQVVYLNKVAVKNGEIDTQVNLSNTLANGMYLLHITAADMQQVARFVISR